MSCSKDKFWNCLFFRQYNFFCCKQLFRICRGKNLEGKLMISDYGELCSSREFFVLAIDLNCSEAKLRICAKNNFFGKNKELLQKEVL